jgi:hypothetical protein
VGRRWRAAGEMIKNNNLEIITHKPGNRISAARYIKHWKLIASDFWTLDDNAMQFDYLCISLNDGSRLTLAVSVTQTFHSDPVI